MIVYFALRHRSLAVTEAQVKRDGQVRAKGSPVHHATLGSLEGTAGPDAVSGTAERAPLGARFVKGKRERLLARAFMIRVIVLMTLMPDARVQDVIAALAGDLALVPWARPWRPASARAAGDWRNALGPVPLEELRDLVLGSAWREHQDRGCPGAVTIGKTRPLKAGSLDGTLLRVPDTPASRAFFGSVGTGDDSSPFPQARALPMTCCSCRALFAMPHGPAGTGKAAAEQSLLDEAMDRYPALFSPGWIWLMDRNYHGAPRIARMIRSTHVLIRLKSDIPLKRTSEILPDCSYRAELSGDGVTVQVRVIEYWVTVEGQEVPETPLLLPGPRPAGTRRLGRRHRDDPRRHPRRRPRRGPRPERTPCRADGPAPRPVLRPRPPGGPVRDPPRTRLLPGRDQRDRGIPEHRRPGPAPRPQVQVPLALPAREREGHRHPHRPRHHHHGQHPRLTSENPVSQPEGNLPARGPGRPRHDTPPSAMPSERKLPTVTKNGNYPQPVKHLKPLVLVCYARREESYVGRRLS